MNKFILIIGAVLFFLMIVFPAEHMVFKVPFILIILLSFIKNLLDKKPIFFKPVLYLILIIVFKGVIWTIIGVFNANKGAFDVFYINVIWYILFGIFISKIKSFYSFNLLLATLIISAFIFVLFDLLIIGGVLGVIGQFDSSLFFNQEEFRFSLNSGFSYLSANHLNNLVFIYPVTIALLISSKVSNYAVLSNKRFLFVLLVLETLLMILSGRRIMFLTILVTPIYLLVFSFFLNKNAKQAVNRFTIKFFIFGAIILFFAINYWFINFDITFSSLLERFSNGFDSNEESTRFDQSKFLLANFFQSPLIGHGAAAEIPGLNRTGQTPWAFELSYYDDLFKTGILGFALFCAFAGGVFLEGVKILKGSNNFLLAGLMTGMLSFLIANATNPFLSSFDYFWPIFLPLSYINLYRLTYLRKL